MTRHSVDDNSYIDMPSVIFKLLIFLLQISPPFYPEGKVSCPVCHKAFSSHSNMRRHAAMHGGRYPYHCQYCNKGFTSNRDRKQHMTQHTNIKYFKCPHCDDEFRIETSLKKHVKEVHSDFGGQ